MATLHEYYEKDFDNTVKLYLKMNFKEVEIEGCVMYDFSAACAFPSFYLPANNFDLNFLKDLVEKVAGGGGVQFAGMAMLPSLRTYHGDIRVINQPDNFEILCRLYGEINWRSTKTISHTRRVFIYSEKELTIPEFESLYEFAKTKSCDLQFRSIKYRDLRSLHETPKGFICHDSRDKEIIAKPLALGLNRLLCPVWYDEFSLKIGDNLRLSIEKGLKECKRCILILSKNFLTNSGWTRTEFDSIFTRQILEQTNLILPI